MNSMGIILMSGWRNSGKDTAADYLCANYGYSKVSFAGILKDMVASEYSIPRDWLDDRELKERPLLEHPVIANDAFSEAIHKLLVAEFKREDGSSASTIGNNRLYWTCRALCIMKGSTNRAFNTKYWVSRVADLCKSLDKVVISDFRYKSEYVSIKQEVNKPTHTIRINRFDSIDTNDPSERDLDNFNFNYTVQNKGTLVDLHRDLDLILKDI